MKRIYILLIGFVSLLSSAVAQQSVQEILSAFPYQQQSEAGKSLASMASWNNAAWRKVFNNMDDDSLRPQAVFALNAFIHHAATSTELSARAAAVLHLGVGTARTFLAKDLVLELSALLAREENIKDLAKMLQDPQMGPRAARSLATIKSPAAIAALEKAKGKASPEMINHINAALAYTRYTLPASQTAPQAAAKASEVNTTQALLDIQDQIKSAANPVEKRQALHKMEKIKGVSALLVTAQYLDDPILQKQAALIMARNALGDKSIRGIAPRESLEKALPLISGVDSVSLTKALRDYLKAIPYDNGWVRLFNGKNLDGWKGLVGNPISRAKMTPEEMLKAQSDANARAGNDWVVDDGLLIFTGHGDNLCTRKQYGDFEMFVDWKITAQGDAGIYLRGSPQVQIWDTSRREVGAQVGSGGLYNNQKNPSKPSQVADNAIGKWNTFHIIMKGDKVTVFLNGIKVTDEVMLENYWDRKLPIFIREQIELQAHGTNVAYRNIFLRELDPVAATPLSAAEQKDGFESLFDGTNLDKWIGNKTGYALEDGVIVTHPELGGGNIYTAEEFGDFEYRFEFQLTPGANNGLGIRTPTTGDAAYVGMELQILDNEAPVYANLKPYQYHGSVYGVIPAKRGFLKPTGEWNEQVVIAKANKIKVVLNGQVIMDGDIQKAAENGTADGNKHPGLLNKKGHIGFLGHGDVVRFRNIRIKRL
ncbi:MAG: hypothetical protein RLY85_1683 [Bacteroidota bacterium]